MGLEIDRVLAGLRHYPTNFAVFIYGTNPKLDVEQKARSNGKKIEKMINATVNVRHEFVDHYDFQNAFNKLFEIFNSLKDDGYNIYVNLSSGSRIISSAALLVSFMTDSIPYYVYPTKYNISKTTTVLSKGYENVVQLPIMAIDTPSDKEIMVLNALKKSGGSISKQNELIPILENLQFFTPKKEREDMKRYNARLRAKLNRFISNLAKRNFVALKKEGRTVTVTLTHSGQLFCK
ncbi:MAG: hypothetical protein JSV49_12590 [Thermoplasmata archaeon]|nr:MAG: hypothetical protein JSV49_12590 [Thermoplasmata archaeon]